MVVLVLLVGVVLGVVVGVAVGVLRARAEVAAAAAQASALAASLARAEEALEGERRLAAARALDERRLTEAFAAVSAEALDRQAGAGRLAVEGAVAPLREQLGLVDAHVRALEASRQGAYGALQEVVRGLAEAHTDLRRETSGLVTALRAPAVRGSWGELQLRRVVELAGMVEHCDFDLQATATGTGDDGVGRLRPDLVVHLPGEGTLVVDSKVPLQGWLDAAGAQDEGARRLAVAAHGRQLRAHVDALAAKRYWEQFQPAPELVVLFVPGEPILSAALEAQPDLYEHALASSVLLATPTSLIGLLKTVAFGWRQEALARNAQQVSDLGRELHDRLAVMVARVDTLGQRLGSTVTAFNATVGSLEGRVLVSARRFTDLEVTTSSLGSARQVETVPRAVTVAPDDAWVEREITAAAQAREQAAVQHQQDPQAEGGAA